MGLIPSHKFHSGGDIHVSTDGNRHHHHLSSVGEGPSFYNPEHFISKEFVDAVGEHIAAAQKPKLKFVCPKVPDTAVDACEKSHYAAQDNQARLDKFDDQGVMSLVCRHDIPLFFANIDTRGGAKVRHGTGETPVFLFTEGCQCCCLV